MVPSDTTRRGTAGIAGKPQVEAAYIHGVGVGRRNGNGQGVPGLAIGIVGRAGIRWLGERHPGIALVRRAVDIEQPPRRGGFKYRVEPVGVGRGTGQLDTLEARGGQARARLRIQVGPATGIAGRRAVDAISGENQAESGKNRVIGGYLHVGHRIGGRGRRAQHGRPGGATVLATPQAGPGGRVHVVRAGVHH